MDNPNASDRVKPEHAEAARQAANGEAGRPVLDFGFIQWVITLVLAAACLIWLWRIVGPEGMVKIALVAAGLGVVIFVHELGHFAVAKWCDVYVETFSIGFGPAIPGCSFRRGETLYKIAWFPLGGYVKMLGEGEPNDEADDNPRSFKNKSVWQRMAIISAGVIMNVVFGLVCFILVYRTHGMERLAGIIRLVDAGSPAWQKGVPSGAVIRQIGRLQNPYFDDVMPEVAFSAKGEKLTLVYSPHDQPDKLESVQIVPRREAKDANPVIGIAQPLQLKLFPKRSKTPVLAALPVSAAAQAVPAFEPGDILIGASDPDHPAQVTPLNDDYFEFEKRLQRLAGKEITIRVRRPEAHSQDSSVLDIHVPPSHHYVFGMRMRMGEITAVREQSPAAEAGIAARNPVQEGDLIDQVEVTQSDGTKTRYVASRTKPVPDDVKTVKDLDPVRLAYELQHWASQQKGSKRVKLIVLRERSVEPKEKTFDLNWDERWTFDREEPFYVTSPMAIPELGLAYRIGTAIEAVEQRLPDGSESPAFNAGLKRGDVIKAIRFRQPLSNNPQASEPGKWIELESDEWAHVFWVTQGEYYKDLSLRVDRDGAIQECDVTAVPDKTWPLVPRGLLLLPDLRLQKAQGVGEAIQLGIQSTRQMIGQIYLSLRAMLTNRVSVTKNLGGPIEIAHTAYIAAGKDIYSFIFFLGLISINLAVINFLPIPILDGGHMVFLIYEKIRGVPASESVRNAATIVGLAVILMLAVFTFWIDIARRL